MKPIPVILPAALALGIIGSATATSAQPTGKARAATPQEGALNPPEGSAVSRPAASASASRNAAAEEEYALALELYKAGDLAGALGALKRCHDETGAANLLFNIAQLHRELGECAAAIRYYKQYIARSPRGERLDDSKRYLDELSSSCEPKSSTERNPSETSLLPSLSRSQAPPEEPPGVGHVSNSHAPRAQPPDVEVRAAPSSGALWPTLGWSALAVSTAATAGTLYASFELARAHRDLEDPKRTGDGAIDGEFVASRQEDFRAYRSWAFGLGSLAVLSAGFGAYALAFAPSDESARHTFALSAAILPHHASLSGHWLF